MSAEAGSSSEASNDLSTSFPGKIQIHLHGSDEAGSRPVPLIWTSSSLRLLREAGLTGSFTGTLPSIPQQNVFLGLPLQLLDEEVVYLIRRQLAVVVDEKQSYITADQEQIDAWNLSWDLDREQQQSQAWQDRLLVKAKYMKKANNTVPTIDPTAEQLAALPWHYTIPSSSAKLSQISSQKDHVVSWYTPKVYTKLSELQAVYPYPTTHAQVGSVALFEHLKSQNMWCMSGLRFGGHFSVYPGDPLRYHSHYTAQLILPSDNISMAHLIANGRLGTAVKKTHLICHLSRFHISLPSKLHTTQTTATPLQEIVSGDFDIAPTVETSDKAAQLVSGRSFADFNTWSLSWAGFGT